MAQILSTLYTEVDRETFARWVAIANMVPANQLFNSLDDSAGTEASRPLIDWINAEWERLASADENFPIFRGGGDLARARFDLFFAVRTTMRALAKTVSKTKRPEGVYTTVVGADLPTFSQRQRVMMLTARGVVLSADPYGQFLNIVEKAGDLVWRLRLCPICEKVVLPRRKDQDACSPECSKTLSMRRWRGKFRKKRREYEANLKKTHEQMAKASSNKPKGAK